MTTRVRRWLPGLLLVSPSIVLIAVFVYGLLGWNFKVAMTDKHNEIAEIPGNFVGLENFVSIWSEERWGLSVRHSIIFTAVFVGGALVLGWFLAFLMEKGIRGEGGFRAIYLFPMAISFIATGVVWRWLMNSATGERAVGLNRLFGYLGMDFLQWQWFRDPIGGWPRWPFRRSGRCPDTSWRCSWPDSAACPRSSARPPASTDATNGRSTGG